MKQKLLLFIVLITIIWVLKFENCYAQGVAINTTGTPADPSAILDVNATNQGILIPRLSTAQRNLLPSPVTGLLIYNTSTNLFNYYNGSEWYEIGITFVSSITGAVHPGGGVSINATNMAPDSSAILDVNDPSRGILVPIPTGVISTPATGLIIYNTSINRFNYYNGSVWIAPCAISTGISGATGSQISIGSAFNISGSPADPSAILDVSAADKGMLIPRLTTTDRNNIKAVTGLTIYNTTTNTIEYYNGSGWYMLEYHVPSITSQPVAQTICAGNNTSFGITATGAGLSYQWQLSTDGGNTWANQANGGVYSNMTTATMNITSATTGMNAYQYHCVVSGTCTPAAISAAVTLTVNALPTPTISPTTAVCANSTGNVYTTASGKTNYLWTVTGGTITAGGGTSNNTVTVTWGAAGTGHVKVNYTDANGCTAASQTDQSITVNALPTPTISPTTAVCANSTGNVYTTASGKTNYLWTVTGGTITAGGGTSNNTVTVTWGAAGTGHVKVNYTDANGCTAASQTDQSITINPASTGATNIYTSSTSFTIPSCVTSVTVKIIGGGGSGGNGGFGAGGLYSGPAGAGGGGGGSGYYSTYTFSVTPGQTLNITVGNGGAAPAGGACNHGNTGNPSSVTYISTTYTANGGVYGNCATEMGCCGPPPCSCAGGAGGGGYNSGGTGGPCASNNPPGTGGSAGTGYLYGGVNYGNGGSGGSGGAGIYYGYCCCYPLYNWGTGNAGSKGAVIVSY